MGWSTYKGVPEATAWVSALPHAGHAVFAATPPNLQLKTITVLFAHKLLSQRRFRRDDEDFVAMPVCFGASRTWQKKIEALFLGRAKFDHSADIGWLIVAEVAQRQLAEFCDRLLQLRRLAGL